MKKQYGGIMNKFDKVMFEGSKLDGASFNGEQIVNFTFDKTLIYEVEDVCYRPDRVENDTLYIKYDSYRCH